MTAAAPRLRRLLQRLNGTTHVDAVLRRVAADLSDRLDGLSARSAASDQQRQRLETEIDRLAAEVVRQGDLLEAAQRDLRVLAQLAIEDEPRTRAHLNRARADEEEYRRPFEVAEPLVSVIIPTYRDVEGLSTRAVPSVLYQTHRHVEVIVIGDGAPEETAGALERLDDRRIVYENLNRRGPYPDDPMAFWRTAGIPALNRGNFLARGEWFAILNDDDAFRPTFVEHLLEKARSERLEVAYGKLRHHEPVAESWDLGTFPPEDHKFGWQMALQHRAMRMFEYELSAHVFDEPGDWNRARRMLRAGVRFGMLDEVVGDYWPSVLWKPST